MRRAWACAPPVARPRNPAPAGEDDDGLPARQHSFAGAIAFLLTGIYFLLGS